MVMMAEDERLEKNKVEERFKIGDLVRYSLSEFSDRWGGLYVVVGYKSSRASSSIEEHSFDSVLVVPQSDGVLAKHYQKSGPDAPGVMTFYGWVFEKVV